MENLFAHDPFREGKVEETLFEATSTLLKYVLVNGHAVPASEIEVNAEEGCVRVAYERGDHRVRPYSGRSLRRVRPDAARTTKNAGS